MKPLLSIAAITLMGITSFSAERTLSAWASGGGAASAGLVTNQSLLTDVTEFCANLTTGYALRPSFVGQLSEVKSIVMTPNEMVVEEDKAIALKAVANCDDGTFSSVSGNEIVWNLPQFPVATISSDGVATAAVVYADGESSITGAYNGFHLSGRIKVLNIAPDNYQAYGGDGLPDAWQILYYGMPPNSNAGPEVDQFGTGNNLFKYVTGLSPIDPNATLRFEIARFPTDSSAVRLSISPTLPDRNYQILRADDIDTEDWTPVSVYETVVTGEVRTIIVRNIPGPVAFFRLNVSLTDGP